MRVFEEAFAMLQFVTGFTTGFVGIVLILAPVLAHTNSLVRKIETIGGGTILLAIGLAIMYCAILATKKRYSQNGK